MATVFSIARISLIVIGALVYSTAMPQTTKQEHPLQTNTLTDADACEVVMDYANREAIQELYAGQTKVPSSEELESIFGEDVAEGLQGTHLEGYWHVDLDGDGKPDDLVIVSEGEINEMSAYAVRNGGDQPAASLDDDKNNNFAVVAVKGHAYILSSDMGNLGKLWRFGKNGSFAEVCEFFLSDHRAIKLITGKHNSVCLDAEHDKISHVKYELKHHLPASTTLLGRGAFEPEDGATQVDIDNDGKTETIVQLNYTYGWGGYMCHAKRIAATDESRTHIPDSKLNSILLKDLTGDGVCGPDIDVFIHNGKTYVDAQEDSGNRSIYLVKNDAAEQVCEFHGHKIFDFAN